MTWIVPALANPWSRLVRMQLPNKAYISPMSISVLCYRLWYLVSLFCSRAVCVFPYLAVRNLPVCRST